MEIDMVRILSDALTAADTRQVTLLGLLDMSAAFDCVDHSILLQRLERNFGISGLAIQWLTSFLTDRMQQVTYNRTLSKLQRLLYGLPQGLALGPLLFNLYTADIGMIVESHGLRLYQYTDNCQVYVSVLVTDAAAAVDQFLPVTCQCG